MGMGFTVVKASTKSDGSFITMSFLVTETLCKVLGVSAVTRRVVES